MSGQMTLCDQLFALLVLAGIVGSWFYVRSDRWRK